MNYDLLGMVNISSHLVTMHDLIAASEIASLGAHVTSDVSTFTGNARDIGRILGGFVIHMTLPCLCLARCFSAYSHYRASVKQCLSFRLRPIE